MFVPEVSNNPPTVFHTNKHITNWLLHLHHLPHLHTSSDEQSHLYHLLTSTSPKHPLANYLTEQRYLWLDYVPTIHYFSSISVHQLHVEVSWFLEAKSHPSSSDMLCLLPTSLHTPSESVYHNANRYFVVLHRRGGASSVQQHSSQVHLYILMQW